MHRLSHTNEYIKSGVAGCSQTAAHKWVQQTERRYTDELPIIALAKDIRGVVVLTVLTGVGSEVELLKRSAPFIPDIMTSYSLSIV
jgi:hypothetical protein